jgi:predicted ABC-type exoprotein transport system permease subunit
MPPWLGAAVSVPTSTLLFWCLAPFLVDITKADVQTAVLFMCVGLLFPATVTLLNFESNRLMGECDDQKRVVDQGKYRQAAGAAKNAAVACCSRA